jgi:subtilisin-like proprotein convertase family protein
MSKKIAVIVAAMGAACAVANAQTSTSYSYIGPAVPIPDSPDGTCGPEAYVEVNVPDTFNVGLAQASLYIPHPWQGDLKVSLTHVATGTTVLLVDQPGTDHTLIGFGASNYGSPASSMQFGDAGTNSYDDTHVAAPGISNVTGTWKGQAPLSAFIGERAAGAWRLRVSDCAGMDTGTIVAFSLTLSGPATCYANCDGSTTAPILNAVDFTCFLQKFNQGCTSPQNCYANCDGSTTAPFLNIADFNCYLQKFALGCTAP